MEEELLLVDAVTSKPLAVGEEVVHHHEQHVSHGAHRPGAVVPTAEPADVAIGPAVTVELQQEQIEVVSPPQPTLTEQLAAIRAGRVLADEAARAVGGQWPRRPRCLPICRTSSRKGGTAGSSSMWDCWQLSS